MAGGIEQLAVEVGPQPYDAEYVPLQCLSQVTRCLFHLVAAVAVRVDDGVHALAEAGQCRARLRREVRASVEGHPLRVEECGQGPAAVAGDRLDRLPAGRACVHVGGDRTGQARVRGE